MCGSRSMLTQSAPQSASKLLVLFMCASEELSTFAISELFTSSPHILPIADVDFSLTMEGSFGWRAEAPFFFGRRLWVI